MDLFYNIKNVSSFKNKIQSNRFSAITNVLAIDKVLHFALSSITFSTISSENRQRRDCFVAATQTS